MKLWNKVVSMTIRIAKELFNEASYFTEELIYEIIRTVPLLAFLFYVYSIPLDNDHLQFFTAMIISLALGMYVCHRVEDLLKPEESTAQRPIILVLLANHPEQEYGEVHYGSPS